MGNPIRASYYKELANIAFRIENTANTLSSLYEKNLLDKEMISIRKEHLRGYIKSLEENLKYIERF